MKLIAFLAFLIPLASTAQNTGDYKQAMAKFRKFYNAGQGDSITAMFKHAPEHSGTPGGMWTNEAIKEIKEEFGSLQSFKFIGIDETDPGKVHVFKTVFSKKGAKTTSLTLYSDKKLGTFRFSTTSGGITALLNKNRNGR